MNPDNVIVVPGGKPTMFFAVLMFGEEGAEIMYPNPGFQFMNLSSNIQAQHPFYRLKEENGFAFDADTVLSQITERTRLMYRSPADPTGGVTPKAEIDKLVTGLAKRLSRDLSDRFIHKCCMMGANVSLLNYPEIRDRLIVLDGWSKTYAMTGWRMGFAVWPDAWSNP